jgi:hypothetical protein
MMRRVRWMRWIRCTGVLGLVCAGVSATPVTAQRATDNRGSTAQREYTPPQRPAPQRPTPQRQVAPAAKAPSAAPAASAAKPTMMIDRQQPVGRRPNVPQSPAQTSTSGQPVSQGSPGMYSTYTNGRGNGSRTTGSDSTSTSTTTTPTTKNPQPSDGSSTGSASNGSKPSTGSGQTQPPVAVYEASPPSDRQPTRQQTPAPQPQLPPRKPRPVPVAHNPPRPWVPLHPAPQPINPTRGLPFLPTTPTNEFQPSPLPVTTETSGASPFPAQQPTGPAQQPTASTQQPSSPAQQPTSGVQQPAAPARQSTSGGGRSQQTAGGQQPRQTTLTTGGEDTSRPLIVPVLTLSRKTNRPVVGKDVVVVAALEPLLPGASYRLNWGDGSAVEAVSGSGTHRYAKAKMYKVSATTVVGSSELNHEILLKVGPVISPAIDGLMAMLAGLGVLMFHVSSAPKFSVSFRKGTPGVPEIKLLTREPYASWSFEPGMRPTEERITFFKKRRKSGSEQG